MMSDDKERVVSGWQKVKDFVDHVVDGTGGGGGKRQRWHCNYCNTYIAQEGKRERESSPLLQGLLCNGYRTIQIAQFKLKENEQENNKWILYIDSVDIAIQCLLLLNYKSSGH